MSITIKSLGNSIDLATREQKYFLELVNEAGQTIHVPITSDGAEATVAFVYGQLAPAPRVMQGPSGEPSEYEQPTYLGQGAPDEDQPSEEYAAPPEIQDDDPQHAAEAAAIERELEEARKESASALKKLKNDGATVFGEEDEEGDVPPQMEIPEEELPGEEGEVPTL